MRVFLILLAALIPGNGLRAQDLRLDDLVREALLHNPEILAAQKKYEAARQRPAQAGSLPDPIFSPGWTSNGNPLPGAGLGSNPTSNIGFSITQEVPYPGKQRLRSNIAGKEAEAQFAELEMAQLGVISKVKQAYFRLQHAYASREVLERNRDLLKKLLAITEIAYSSRKAAQQDVFKAQVQLSLLEAKVLQIERERRLRESELNTLIDRTLSTPLGKPAEPHLGSIPKTLTELQTRALETAPGRMRDQKMTERAELAVNLAHKDYYPDYAISGGYFNQAGMPPMYSFRADIKIPLYFRTKQRAALTEQSLMLSQARHTYEATGKSLSFRIADEYSGAQTSLEIVNLYLKTLLPQARLTIDSATASYETGAVDFLSVLNNYTASLEFEMGYHEEMLNYHLALSRLEELTGQGLIKEEHQ